MKIRIELETTEAETFSALDRLDYFADRLREAAAMFQGKIIDEMAVDFPWPPAKEWPQDEEEDNQDWPSDEVEEEEEDEEEQEDEEEREDETSSEDVVMPYPVDLEQLRHTNTAPLWHTVALSAASNPYEAEEKEAAMPEYMKRETDTKQREVVPPAANRNLQLPQISDELRTEASEVFTDLIRTWSENFDAEGPQPDRLEELRKLGSGRYALPVLVMSYEIGSLQRLVEKALIACGILEHASQKSDRLEYADRIAANMVQISHMVFPDLAGTYDYSTKWRRG